MKLETRLDIGDQVTLNIDGGDGVRKCHGTVRLLSIQIGAEGVREYAVVDGMPEVYSGALQVDKLERGWT
jgi:hypothetical protein